MRVNKEGGFFKIEKQDVGKIRASTNFQSNQSEGLCDFLLHNPGRLGEEKGDNEGDFWIEDWNKRSSTCQDKRFWDSRQN